MPSFSWLANASPGDNNILLASRTNRTAGLVWPKTIFAPPIIKFTKQQNTQILYTYFSDNKRKTKLLISQIKILLSVQSFHKIFLETEEYFNSLAYG